ncbi:MAG: hypothetical protein QOA56_09115, partial [Nitrososphaeraceae archaeon]|nr:hypothetical protein [Nitrososphaeraceae archaeon]
MRTSVEKSPGWLRGIQIGLGIITVFLPVKGKWVTIGLGILIFAGLAISFPAATALIVTIFVGIGLIFHGCARIVEGIS